MRRSLSAIAMKTTLWPSISIDSAKNSELGSGSPWPQCFCFQSWRSAKAATKVVKAQGFASVERVAPQSKFKLAVVLEVANGYHINAHVPTLDLSDSHERCIPAPCWNPRFRTALPASSHPHVRVCASGPARSA